MGRSKEALARRAERRGISLEEQMKRDRGVGIQVDKHKALSRKASNKHKSTQSDNREKIQIEPAEWICLKCMNKNFAHRTQCNRCGLRKHQEIATEGDDELVENHNETHVKVEKLETKLKKAGEEGELKQVSEFNQRVKKFKASQGTKRKDRDRDGDSATSVRTKSRKGEWAPQASTEHILRGAELRAMSEEELCKLSEEEQSRARILKERSERKKAKKQKQLEFKSQQVRYLRKVAAKNPKSH